MAKRALDCDCEGCSLWRIIEDDTEDHGVILKCNTCGREYFAYLDIPKQAGLGTQELPE